MNQKFQKVQTRRTKKVIAEMLPVKKWLTMQEGASYMNMHIDTLRKLVNDKGLTISIIGDKHYVKVSELEGMIEESVFRKKSLVH